MRVRSTRGMFLTERPISKLQPMVVGHLHKLERLHGSRGNKEWRLKANCQDYPINFFVFMDSASSCLQSSTILTFPMYLFSYLPSHNTSPLTEESL